MAAPRVGEQLVVQDPLEGPEQDSGQVAFDLRKHKKFFAKVKISKSRIRVLKIWGA
jgi:hypothetical protein